MGNQNVQWSGTLKTEVVSSIRLESYCFLATTTTRIESLMLHIAVATGMDWNNAIM